MNIQARLLTVDFYNCKAEQCSDEAAVRAKVSTALRELDLVPLQIISEIQENGHISLMSLLPNGHLALHVHPELHYVSLDIYLCAEDAALDPIARVLRKAFQPENNTSAARRLPQPRRDSAKDNDARRSHPQNQEHRSKGHPHSRTT